MTERAFAHQSTALFAVTAPVWGCWRMARLLFRTLHGLLITLSVQGTKVHFYVYQFRQTNNFAGIKEAFLGEMGQMLEPPYPPEQHPNG